MDTLVELGATASYGYSVFELFAMTASKALRLNLFKVYDSKRGKEIKMTKTISLKKRYEDEIKAAMKEKFGYENDMMIPKLHKIVLNMGVGEASHNSKIADVIEGQLTKIAGQKAVVTKAKKSIASYKLREGMPVGAMVTLRGERMYDFLQKLICVVLPRIRDFRGISAKSFDGRGNYTLGLKEQSLFPEITYEEVDLVKGMNVSIITTAKTDDEARELLRLIGMPFKGMNKQ